MIDRTRRFEDKVVFITGVARGQGRSHAVAFASEGARIIGVDLCDALPHTPYPLATEDDLAETVRQVESAGGAMHAAVADVRELPALREAIKAGIEKFGRLDVIVANAGTYSPGPTQWLTSEAWDETIAVNLTGVFNTVRAGMNRMIEFGNGGSIVITSSTAGIRGFYGAPAYSAAKHGVVGFARSLANEMAPLNIRVNTIHPTSVNTPMINNEVFPKLVRMDLEDPNFHDAGEFLATMQSMDIPWIEPIDISNAMLWLCSDEARYITGVSLPVDGGAMQK
jgi:(+)-trans-carveol dehydrogenase